MKKLFTLVLVLSLSMFTFACKKAEDPAPADDAAPAANDAADDAADDAAADDAAADDAAADDAAADDAAEPTE